MPSLRVGRRGQITIPSDLRRKLRVVEGDQLIVEIREGSMVLTPAGRPIFQLRGSVPVDGPQDFTAILDQTLSQRAKRNMDAADE
jgi:AbrB family looped-hinge helix DNA binding protein